MARQHGGAQYAETFTVELAAAMSAKLDELVAEALPLPETTFAGLFGKNKETFHTWIARANSATAPAHLKEFVGVYRSKMAEAKAARFRRIMATAEENGDAKTQLAAISGMFPHEFSDKRIAMQVANVHAHKHLHLSSGQTDPMAALEGLVRKMLPQGADTAGVIDVTPEDRTVEVGAVDRVPVAAQLDLSGAPEESEPVAMKAESEEFDEQEYSEEF